MMKKSVWNDAKYGKINQFPGSWGEVSKSVNARDDSCLTLKMMIIKRVLARRAVMKY
jgi:hypothetical protein